MTPGEISTILKNIKQVQWKFDLASGAAVAVEVRMRLIGQLCEPVRDQLKKCVVYELIERKKKNPNAKCKSYKHWNCELSFLEKAIDQVFYKELDLGERLKIEKFRPLRNKLLHGDFVSLMILMGIDPTGRQILSNVGNRNILDKGDVIEAVLSIDGNQGFEELEILAREVKDILDKLILGLATK